MYSIRISSITPTVSFAGFRSSPKPYIRFFTNVKKVACLIKHFLGSRNQLAFFGKQPFRQGSSLIGHRSRLQSIARGLDDFHFKPQPGKCRAALRRNQICLRQCQRAAAGANDNRFFRHKILTTDEHRLTQMKSKQAERKQLTRTTRQSL